MAEDHGVRSGKQPAHPREPSLRGPGVMNNRDHVAGGVELGRLGQTLAHLGGIDIAVNGLHRRTQRLQPVEHVDGAEITRVDDQIS